MATAKPNSPSIDRPHAAHHRITIWVSLAIMTWACWLTRTPAYQPLPFTIEQESMIAVKIDLNSDPWWKLASLPNIGMVKAKRIVTFRTRCSERPAFVTADDLQRVRGIGPKTTARIAPLLEVTAHLAGMMDRTSLALGEDSRREDR